MILLDRVRVLADDVLFPQAIAVERGEAQLGDGLDRLAAERLYGLRVPVQFGGLGAGDRTDLPIIEALAGGDLATTFVWLQHLGVVDRLALIPGPVRDGMLFRLAAGELRAGVGSGGVEFADDPLVARPTSTGDWQLHGTIPWVSGWGHVDVVLIAAQTHRDDDVLWLLIDAPEVRIGPDRALCATHDDVRLTRIDLVAIDATNTAAVTFDGHTVPADRLLLRRPLESTPARAPMSARTTAALSIGIAHRCARLGANAVLVDEVDEARARVHAATDPELEPLRAAAAALALRAATTLMATTGSTSVARTDHSQRLAREALLLQVFGRPR